MTTNVPKGANRPYAAGKRAKASQSSALPPRTENQREARSLEIAAAREELMARVSERAGRAEIKRSADPAWGSAQAFIAQGEHNGWSSSGCVISYPRLPYSERVTKVTAIITRGDERLAASWVGADLDGHPLYSVGGRNIRLPSIAEALERVYGAPGTSGEER